MSTSTKQEASGFSSGANPPPEIWKDRDDLMVLGEDHVQIASLDGPKYWDPSPRQLAIKRFRNADGQLDKARSLKGLRSMGVEPVYIAEDFKEYLESLMAGFEHSGRLSTTQSFIDARDIQAKPTSRTAQNVVFAFLMGIVILASFYLHWFFILLLCIGAAYRHRRRWMEENDAKRKARLPKRQWRWERTLFSNQVMCEEIPLEIIEIGAKLREKIAFGCRVEMYVHYPVKIGVSMKQADIVMHHREIGILTIDEYSYNESHQREYMEPLIVGIWGFQSQLSH